MPKEQEEFGFIDPGFIDPGTRVMLRRPPTPDQNGKEVGVVIHCWYDEKHDWYDTYVAFFGEEFPDGQPKDKPYVLKYLTSSLVRV